MMGKKHKKRQNAVLISLIVLFVPINIIYPSLHEGVLTFWSKLFAASFLPWIYMFLIGVLFQKNFVRIYQVLRAKAIPVLIGYSILAYLEKSYLGWFSGNIINHIMYIPLTLLIFACAYSFPNLSTSLLRKNDISYGIYIYHVPNN